MSIAREIATKGTKAQRLTIFFVFLCASVALWQSDIHSQTALEVAHCTSVRSNDSRRLLVARRESKENLLYSSCKSTRPRSHKNEIADEAACDFCDAQRLRDGAGLALALGRTDGQRLAEGVREVGPHLHPADRHPGEARPARADGVGLNSSARIRGAGDEERIRGGLPGL